MTKKKDHCMKLWKSPPVLELLYHAATVLGVALLLNSCAVERPVYRPVPEQPERIPTKPPAQQPATGVYSPELGAAKSLYHAADKSLAAGNTQDALLSMERALRIEPRNAHYWYTMARIKYQQREYAQTIQFCLKSKSLAGNNQDLLTRNDTLIERARTHLQ
jgi:tetratricopeptide (TPR) repeat protein